ncbi:MAG: hypothetical protein HYV07_22400 [Deltaproteobacteria bacterium]|nr:hypothetical protein [Deltaproteobacteria bacterium]
MHSVFDWIGKQVLVRAYENVGEVTPNAEVGAADSQAVDVAFVPDPKHKKDLRSLGLLGRMARKRCLFELFHNTPETFRVRDSVRKQLNLRHLELLASTVRERDVPRHLWIVSSGVPRSAIAEFGMVQDPAWPPGFFFAERAWSLAIVAVSRLPRTRATLLLRLVGKGKVLSNALSDLMALLDTSWEKQLAMPVLIEVKLTKPSELAADLELEDWKMLGDRLERYEAWQKERVERGIELGMERGMERGLRRAVASLYAARFGPLSTSLHESLEACHDAPTLERLIMLAGTGSEAEFAAALHSDPNT